MADDVRPMTDKVQVMAPQQVEYTINIKYYCTKDDEAATIETIEGDGGANRPIYCLASGGAGAGHQP